MWTYKCNMATGRFGMQTTALCTYQNHLCHHVARRLFAESNPEPAQTTRTWNHPEQGGFMALLIIADVSNHS